MDIYENRIEWRNEKGFLHREDGPAIEWRNGDKSWYLNGKRHRYDGPAVECGNGDKYWYLHGKELTEEKFNMKVLKSGRTITINKSKYKLVKVEEDV